MSRIDHTNCTHPRTPAGRRACRNGATAPAPKVDYIAEHIRKTAANGAMKARMDRKYAEIKAERMAEIRANADDSREIAEYLVHKAENARIQPRRSGARVSADNSSCVQAALHTHGRCACGWENWDVAS